MKNFKILFLLLSVSLFGLASCEESSDAGEYGNWQERNIAYIDSIATVARNNSDGKWKRFLAVGLDENKEHGNEYYVYCKELQPGDGTEHPYYTDIVSVNYRGSLINDFVFDSSYDGVLEPDFDVPVTFQLSGTVSGFSLALQHMVKGDMWRVYIPAGLGYGTQESSGIPANSTLIFDINLVSFQR